MNAEVDSRGVEDKRTSAELLRDFWAARLLENVVERKKTCNLIAAIFVERHRFRLRYLGMSRGFLESDADSWAFEALTRALLQPGNFDPNTGNVEGWLTTIYVNLINSSFRNLLREESALGEAVQNGKAKLERQDDDEDWENLNKRELIVSLLMEAGVSERNREIFCMVVLDRIPPKDVANLYYKMTEKTVKNIVSVCKQTLKKFGS